MKTILLILFLSLFALSQQINYTWGTNTSGTAYTQTGQGSLDSSSTVSIVFDMQDYYWLDYYPLVVSDTSDISTGGDSVQAAAVYDNSNRHHFGTFWLRLDAQNATDSVGYALKAYPGNLVYHPNDESRVTTTNVNFGTTATTIVDTGATKAVNDIQWTPYNVFLNYSANKFLPPEFIKITLTFQKNAADSMAAYWNFAYPAVYEFYQTQRQTTRSKSDARKEEKSLH